MRTALDRINAIRAAEQPTRDMVTFETPNDVAMEVARVALATRLGWTILVNGIPCEEEWLEVSSHESHGASDVVVILRQKITDEYLGSLIGTSISRGDLTDRIIAVDAHMGKAMALHNICPK